MKAISQILAITAMNLRSISQRLGTSLVIVIGIAGVVAVLVSMLAMSSGFLKTMRDTGRDDRAIVLRAGAVSEQSSVILREDIEAIASAPGIKRMPDGKPIYSAEVVTLLSLDTRDGTLGSIPLRGVSTNGEALRPEIKIVAGRMFSPSLNEVIVGRRARDLYQDLDVGTEIKRQNANWKVVGVFESNGDVHESEIITNSTMLQSAIKWEGVYRSTVVMLESPEALSRFRDALTSNPSISVDVFSEREFYEEQSKAVSSMLEFVAKFVGSIMAIAALCGALNAMYSAVDSRTTEIGTLRALGFGAGPIVTSILVEAMLLAVCGGVAGALLSWLLFSDYTVSTSAVGSVSAPQTRAFNMSVTPSIMFVGLVWASFIGFIGGLLPSIRAARLPIAESLRSL
jgi:putative ABC transport system permease protein